MEFEYLNATEAGKAAFEQLALPGHPSYVIFDAAGNETFRSFSIVSKDTLEQAILAIVEG